MIDTLVWISAGFLAAASINLYRLLRNAGREVIDLKKRVMDLKTTLDKNKNQYLEDLYQNSLDKDAQIHSQSKEQREHYLKLSQECEDKLQKYQEVVDSYYNDGYEELLDEMEKRDQVHHMLEKLKELGYKVTLS